MKFELFNPTQYTIKYTWDNIQLGWWAYFYEFPTTRCFGKTKASAFARLVMANSDSF